MKASSAAAAKRPSGWRMRGHGRRPVRGEQCRAHRQRQQQYQADDEIARIHGDRACPCRGVRVGGDHQGEIEWRKHQCEHVRDRGDRKRQREVAASQVRNDVGQRATRTSRDQHHGRLRRRRQVEQQRRHQGRGREQHELREEADSDGERMTHDIAEIRNAQIERHAVDHGRKDRHQDRLLHLSPCCRFCAIYQVSCVRGGCTTAVQDRNRATLTFRRPAASIGTSKGFCDPFKWHRGCFDWH